jgi:hypothetical protein
MNAAPGVRVDLLVQPIPSRTPRILGILSMAFGGYFAYSWLGGGPINASWSADPASDLARDGEVLLPAVAHANLALLAMSVALLGVGAGQYFYKRWAVVATTAWAVAAIAVALGIAAMMAGGVAPAMTEPFLAYTLAGFQVLLLPYPIVLLVAFRRQMVRASMIR